MHNDIWNSLETRFVQSIPGLAKKLLAEVLSFVCDHCLEVRVEERVLFFETRQCTFDHILNEKLFWTHFQFRWYSFSFGHTLDIFFNFDETFGDLDCKFLLSTRHSSIWTHFDVDTFLHSIFETISNLGFSFRNGSSISPPSFLNVLKTI